jgi:hypothetical protein
VISKLQLLKVQVAGHTKSAFSSELDEIAADSTESIENGQRLLVVREGGVSETVHNSLCDVFGHGFWGH